MIVFPLDSTVDAAILDRAMLFAGDGEGDLYLPWLDTPGVYAVPEDNIYGPLNKGVPDRLRRACAVYPDSTWGAVRMQGRELALSERSIVTDPAADLENHVGSDGSVTSLITLYLGGSILLFSMEYPAAVLFSALEITLVTGSEEFVRAYFDDKITDALKTFHDEWADLVGHYDTWENPKSAQSSRRFYRRVCDQMRLPPGVTIPEGFEVL